MRLAAVRSTAHRPFPPATLGTEAPRPSMTLLPDELPAVDAEMVVLDMLLNVQADNFGIPCQDVPLAIPPDTFSG